MYRSLKESLLDLQRHKLLAVVSEEVDPHLVMAEVHRRVFAANGPALWFQRVKGSPFSAASNIYGSKERVRFLFRDTLAKVEDLVRVKNDPSFLLRHWSRTPQVAWTALKALPRRVRSQTPVEYGTTTIDQLPQIVGWPKDGGAFITLPQVCTLPPRDRQMMHSNLGMYRIQLSGNQYEPNQEVGLHYQLHRGIGIHHQQYNQAEIPFPASIFVGGPPSHAFTAIMPLPEGLSEMTFAGMLAGRRFHYRWLGNHVVSGDADFCILGTIRKDGLKPEGPFGDHLGYYSLEHPFPVMDVEQVLHRKDAVWHFTVVGRPPQEDSWFGYLIHEIVKPLASAEFPGLVSLNAVDAAGVHPLLLAVGKERYMPFRDQRPEEILTIANHLLGKGQTSLAKFLIIAAQDDYTDLDAAHIPEFFKHVLERVRWERDLHFQTQTTMDTLDYSGHGWNAGSKVVIAIRGDKRRTLGTNVPERFPGLDHVRDVRVALPGILCLGFAPYIDPEQTRRQLEVLAAALPPSFVNQFPLIILVDDASFTSANLENFLWVTFTRSNPAPDIYGVDAFIHEKHWGCHGSLILDARIKPHHAPVLEVDAPTRKEADKLFAPGGSLHGIA
ncbi:MAG: UbiD family decarboxylase [Saprospiraceae bacterium]|nr:UbiD family decarboxylase [Saprospiraceae bacterium]